MNWLTLDRAVDSRLPFGGVIEPGRSERGGVAGLEGSVADRTIDAWSRTAPNRELGGSDLYSLAAALRGALARSAEKYGKWKTIYRRFRRWSEAGTWEIVSVTLAERMADTGHYSIDSTTIRGHVSAAGVKGGLIDRLLDARGAGSAVRFTASPMLMGDRSPSI
jgi:hypothetical protein|nr:hypothetical protein [Sphingomonas sp. Leaf208]